MNIIRRFTETCLMAIACFAVSVAWAQPGPEPPVKQKPLIIFDTDIGPDYDDVGAIAVLHTLARKGECEILATVASDAYPAVAPTIAVLNRYFGRPDIPVGRASAGSPDLSSGNAWNEGLLSRFSEPEDRSLSSDFPEAVAVYRQVLAAQPDHSVTIVTVGFVTNMMNLLNSVPDKYSPLSGMDLVRKKVYKWVAMAGSFPEGREFNVEKDASASFEVFSKWPGPILFSGFEIGQHILTGALTARGDTSRNPVAWAYSYNLRTYAGKPEASRPSWDQTAVLCAVRSPEDYFYVNGPGRFRTDPQGNNAWDPELKKGHFFLSHKYPYSKIAADIEALMLGR